MDDQLLIRVYNVGLGDCIYLRIPDGAARRHVLIDCGSKTEATAGLRRAMDHLRLELPKDAAGMPRLDLLVVTHAHEDHLCGFGKSAAFHGIEVSNLWMSVAMDPKHPQAQQAKKLHAVAQTALRELAASPRRGVADWAQAMLALANAGAMDFLLSEKLKGVRKFVHAAKQPESIFEDARTRFTVIAPEPDIDGTYLGRDTAFDLGQLTLGATEGDGEASGESAIAPRPTATPPRHVCAEDFARLREGMARQSLAFVQKDSELINNTSVVLLLEWHGRRLLFTGDAEFSPARAGVFTKDKHNGSWNTMWTKRREAFTPVDFLKVGHHGSENATPWTRDRPRVNEILDALLPLPQAGEASTRVAVVSTARTNLFPTIPDPFLMTELGRRIGNPATTYEEVPNAGHFVATGIPQPLRTDLERRDGQSVAFVEVGFAARS